MKKSELHIVAQTNFDEFERDSVLPLLKIADAVFGEDFYSRSAWTYWSDPESTYEDDGFTKSKGTKYQALCSVAIARPIGDGWQEKLDWWYGHGHSVISFHSHVQLRDHDSKIKYSGCSLQVSPFMADPNVKNSSTRIDYSTNGSKMQFHKNEFHLLRFCTLLKANFDAKVMLDRIKTVIAAA